MTAKQPLSTPAQIAIAVAVVNAIATILAVGIAWGSLRQSIRDVSANVDRVSTRLDALIASEHR